MIKLKNLLENLIRQMSTLCLKSSKKQEKIRYYKNKKGGKNRLFYLLIVRRTGMTKPPVQLGVGKNTLV